MHKLARILLVEPETDLRRELDRHLERAGHEVAAVPGPGAARDLVLEGLLPDVVLADARDPEVERTLQEILPDAMHLRIYRGELSGDGEGAPAGESACPADPGEILRRVEEVLVHFTPRPGDDATRCMDLARRLASSLPKSRTAAERIELVTDGFDAFFGVEGTLVVRRGPSDAWIEVRQGMEEDLAARVSHEISRRTRHRGLRPFLVQLEQDGRVRSVACLAVQVGEVETDVAIALRTAPALPNHRESLMNLVGSAMRSAMSEEAVEDTRELLDAQVSSFESLLTMTREFVSVADRRELSEGILRSLHRELGMTRSVLFLSRDGGRGMLDLAAIRGFAADLLDRIGLSTFHGVGAECLRARSAGRGQSALGGAGPRGVRSAGSAVLRLSGRGRRPGGAGPADPPRAARSRGGGASGARALRGAPRLLHAHAAWSRVGDGAAPSGPARTRRAGRETRGPHGTVPGNERGRAA